MPAWKVFLTVLLAIVCLGLTLATIAIPISQEGGDRWLWLAGLLMATFVTGGLLALFLRHASTSLEYKSPWARNP